jgi:multidrug resistance efflux pump
MELDDKYFEIAKERIEKAIAEKERMLFKDI